jgi:hypothetical protein
MGSLGDPYDVLARTPAETRRAYDLFRRRTSDGVVELSVCCNCGEWARWDSELARPTNGCYEGKRHRIARVRVRAETP